MSLWPNFWASPTFFSTDNNLSCLLYSRLPSFYNFLCIFLGQNAYNTNFLPNFLNFSHFWQLWPNIWASPTFFPIFFQLIILYHVFCILDYTHFINFCVFYCVKMHIIQIFYQIFSIFLIFDNFYLIFGPPLLFFCPPMLNLIPTSLTVCICQLLQLLNI